MSAHALYTATSIVLALNCLGVLSVWLALRIRHRTLWEELGRPAPWGSTRGRLVPTPISDWFWKSKYRSTQDPLLIIISDLTKILSFAFLVLLFVFFVALFLRSG